MEDGLTLRAARVEISCLYWQYFIVIDVNSAVAKLSLMLHGALGVRYALEKLAAGNRSRATVCEVRLLLPHAKSNFPPNLGCPIHILNHMADLG